MRLVKIWRNSFSFRFAFVGRRDGQTNWPASLRTFLSQRGDDSITITTTSSITTAITSASVGLLPQTKQPKRQIPPPLRTSEPVMFWPWQIHASAFPLNLDYFGRVRFAAAVRVAARGNFHGQLRGGKWQVRSTFSATPVLAWSAESGGCWPTARMGQKPNVCELNPFGQTLHFDWFLFLFFCNLMGYDVLGGQWPPHSVSWPFGHLPSCGGSGVCWYFLAKKLAEDKANQLLHMQTRRTPRWRYFSAFLNDAWRRKIANGQKKRARKLLLLYFLHFKIRLHMGSARLFGHYKSRCKFGANHTNRPGVNTDQQFSSSANS